MNTFNPLSRAIDLDYIKKCSKALSDEISSKYDPDIVIGIARGGIYPAYQISKNLGTDLDYIHISRYSKLKSLDQIPGAKTIRKIKYAFTEGTFLKPILIKDNEKDIKEKKVLVVDDTTGRGATLEFSKKILNRKKPEEIKTATIISTYHDYEPDFFVLKDLDINLIKPWSMASPYYEEFLDEISRINI